MLSTLFWVILMDFLLLYFRFECEHCGNNFESEETRRQHITSVHFGRIQCPLCPKNFSRKSGLRNHTDSMHPDPNAIGNYACESPGCDKVYNSNSQLKKHVTRWHIIVECPSPGCNFKGAKWQLVVHKQRSHMNRYMCPHCSLNMASNTTLSDHVALYHDNNCAGKNDPDNMRKCDDCAGVFLNQELKRRHKCPGRDTALNAKAVTRRFNKLKFEAMTRPTGDYDEGQESPIKMSRIVKGWC